MSHIKKLVMQGFKSFPRKTEIPFTKGINVILGPNGSGKSSSYDTIVTLSDGSEMELGKLVEDQISKSNNVKTLDDGVYVDGSENIKIISLNKEGMKTEEKLVSKFIKREGDVLYKIKTRSGRELKATGCHPVISYSNREIKSRLIREMQKGFVVATPREIKVNSEREDKHLARFIGYVIGDGYIANDRIEFVNKDKEVLEDFEKLLLKYSKWGIRKRVSGETVRIYSRDRELYKKFRDLYPEIKSKTITSKSKVIPNEVLSLGKKSVGHLIAALFDTDGSIRKNIGTIEFCTKNKNLARQVQSLLLRFGISSKIKKRFSSAKNTKNRVKRKYHYLYVYGYENIKNFYMNIPLRINYKKKSLKNLIDKAISSNPNVDLIPREINKEIKRIVKNLGIKIKKVRKEYSALAAYTEDRCAPSREGIKRILELFNHKLAALISNYNKIFSLDQQGLIEFMDMMGISSRESAESIGLHKTIIRNQWAKNLFMAREGNLEKFRRYLINSYLIRTSEAGKTINLLTNLSNSDIFWDEVVSIEKLDKPKWVYDLSISGNHNFIANNIFVHNSNISDALCFVLGRLSIKSIRAAKARNLIFLGTKTASPAKEASVEIVFDNLEKTFSIDKDEISIKRIVRRNGQSVYKINNETKTRQEILSLLAQAGIDPKGFNIVLQGEIQNFVRMQPEERRGIIEEVSGISIYELRKEKSLRELEKTEEKLKEINSILRERTSYLNNLEKERQQALRFKKLENNIKRFKASIIYHNLYKKKKETESINSNIEKKNKEIEKIKIIITGIEEEIKKFKSRIDGINSEIQKSTGLEQEKLNQEIANLRAELAGTNVKLENYESKIISLLKQKEELYKSIKETEISIKELQKESPTPEKKTEEIETKKKELENIEEQRKRFYMIKSEMNSVKERIQDKNALLQNHADESDLLIKQIKSFSIEIFDLRADQQKLDKLKISLAEKRGTLSNLLKKEIELEKINSINESEIENLNKILKKISKLDICPICKSRITPKHMGEIREEIVPKIESLRKEIENADKELKIIYQKKEILIGDIEEITQQISKTESDLNKLSNIHDKKSQLKIIQEKNEELNEEIFVLEKRKKTLEKTIETISNIEQKYETMKVEIQEISLRSKGTLKSDVAFKERELDRLKISFKQTLREEENVKEEFAELKKVLVEKEKILANKKQQEEELSKKFREMISERDSFQARVREKESETLSKQNILHNTEQEMNDFKIEKARVDAEIENLETEMLEFESVEIIRAGKDSLIQRLEKTQDTLSKIGTVNLRSLEVYDSIKKEYDAVKEKTEIISKEKEGILKIIHAIDVKKKKTFIHTLKKLNELFSRNFSQLSTKGHVFLELENRKDPFDGGVNVIVKTGHGKYFDVKSLSGGEQTIVALSLIFAIQEYSPYCFYLLDEVDATLDKRNSERLAGLLSKYMQRGQYIVITHNDEVISKATNIYGISMHDGISKIISLRV